jgi:hypothetical protein
LELVKILGDQTEHVVSSEDDAAYRYPKKKRLPMKITFKQKKEGTYSGPSRMGTHVIPHLGM